MDGIAGVERFALVGRIALVTGATRGLGLEIARGMSAAGAVVGVNGRDARQCAQVAAAIFLASDAASYITGQVLTIDARGGVRS